MYQFKQAKTSILAIPWIILLCLGLFSCEANSESKSSQINEGLEFNSPSSNGQLKTATAPASPDLRGTSFTVVLIQAEDEMYDSLMNTIAAGIEDGIRHLNSSGGINGARMNLSRKSFHPDSGDIGLEITDYIIRVDPILIFIAYPINENLLADLSNINIPILSFGIGNEVSSSSTAYMKNFFWLVPPPDNQIAFFLSEVWKHWDQLRPAGIFNQMTSGVISSDINGDQLSLYPSLPHFLEERNFDLALQRRFSAELNSSATNFLIDAITLGVTVIFCDTKSEATAIVLNDLNSMAVTDFFIVGGGVWSFDGEITDRLVSNEPFEGYLVALSVPWWNDPNSSAIRDAQDIHSRYSRPLWMKDAGYLIALGAVDIARAALINTVQENNSGDFRPGDILDQVAGLSNYQVMGDLFELDYSGENKYPAFLRLWQVSVGGDWIPIGEGGEAPDLGTGD